MPNFSKDRTAVVKAEKGALTYLVITYLTTLVVASATITLLCRAISG